MSPACRKRRLRSCLAGAAFALVQSASCARAPAPAAPTPVPADTTVEAITRADSIARAAALTEIRQRHTVRPVPRPQGFEQALRNGTRRADGRPGPNYWQQRVEYRIEAELDPATARLRGVGTVVYHNQSPDTLRHLLFNLYQNLFEERAQRVRRVPITGGMTIERIAVDGRAAGQGASAPTYDIDGTLMAVALPRPLPPGGRVSVDVAWSFTVPPPGAPRTGHDRRQAFVVAQWYPQVATYDDVKGWHALPYWGNGEFYLEYGDFDVAITAPEGWLVSATGILENADELLPDPLRQQLLRARATDDVVHVVTADDHTARTATVREPGGQLTWRFRARDVRDFAFATSDRYLWDATRAILPSRHGPQRADTVLVHAFYRPYATLWREAARYVRHAVTFHARNWHPYIYPHISAAEGPIGGMEYPMLMFVGPFTDPESLYEVLSHEVAHQWWAMMVGSNETEFAWQDEGLTSYVENLSVHDFFPRSDPFTLTMLSYLDIAGTDVERPIMREADLYGPGPQYGIATYHKPAMLFRALEAIIGQRALHAALRTYADRWLLRHPTPWDLFNTIEDVAGRDLGWFWYPWFFETAVLDHAIVSVDVYPATGGGERVVVVVEDQGDAPMPVPLVFTTSSGETRRIDLPVEPWLEGRIRQLVTVELPAPVSRIEIDPDRIFPDIDRTDNVWLRETAGVDR